MDTTSTQILLIKNGWINQISRTWDDVQNFPYHDQRQYEQPVLQQYVYSPLPQEPKHSFTNVDVEVEKTSEMFKVLMHELNELKIQNMMMETQIAELVSSSSTRELDFLPAQHIQEDESVVTFNTDMVYDNLSMHGDNNTVEIKKEHAINDKVGDFVVVVEDNVGKDEVRHESNTKMVVSFPQPVPKLPFPN